MVRPLLPRQVGCPPQAGYFKPRGIPLGQLEEIGLTLDELEAVRLADLEEMYQEQAAKQMRVSRPTFGNIVAAAHKKIADALVNGKALRIEGGAVELTGICACPACGHKWRCAETPSMTCPSCGSAGRAAPPAGCGRRRRCRGGR